MGGTLALPALGRSLRVRRPRLATSVLFNKHNHFYLGIAVGIPKAVRVSLSQYDVLGSVKLNMNLIPISAGLPAAAGFMSKCTLFWLIVTIVLVVSYYSIKH